jgi:hypothetical protein
MRRVTPSPTGGRKKRFGRPLRLAAIALVAVELLYVVAANLFLASDWGHSRLNRRPEKLSMHWSRAWTLLPGLVHVRELELEGRARRASWRVEVQRGRLWIWLPSLAGRHLRLLSAAATGSSVAVAAQPPPEGPRKERRRRGWRISIDRLDLSALESLRFGRVSVEGDGRLRGSARFEVGGPMAFDVSQLSFHRARVLAGEDLAADSLTLDAALEVAEVTIGEVTIFDLLAGTSGEIDLEAETSNLGFLTAYLGRFPWIDIDGAGHLALDLELTDGWLAPGSSLDFSGPAISATYLGLTARGAGVVRGRVPEGAGHVRIDAEFADYGVERLVDGRALLAGNGLSVTVTNDSTAIDRPAEGVAVSIRMPEARVPDLAALDVYIPASTGLALTGGEATVSAEVDYSAAAKVGHGSLRLAGQQIVATFDDSELQADLVLEARFPTIELESGVVAIDGTTLDVTGVQSLQGGGEPATGWWGNFRVPSGTLRRRFGAEQPEPAMITGLLTARLLNTSPLTAVIRRRVPKLRWFDRLLTVENVELESRFRLVGPAVRLRSIEISGGAKDRLEIQAELDLSKERADGVVFVAWGPLTAAVALDDKSRDWKLTRSHRWYEAEAAAYRAARAPD